MSQSTIYAETMGFRRDEFIRLRFLGQAGWLALQIGALDVAEAVFNGLRAVAPEDSVAHLGLAEICLSRGDLDGAEAAARVLQAAENADISGRAHGLVCEARSRWARGDAESARTLLDLALALDPNGSGGAHATAIAQAFEILMAPTTVTPVDANEGGN